MTFVSSNTEGEVPTRPDRGEATRGCRGAITGGERTGGDDTAPGCSTLRGGGRRAPGLARAYSTIRDLLVVVGGRAKQAAAPRRREAGLASIRAVSRGFRSGTAEGRREHRPGHDALSGSAAMLFVLALAKLGESEAVRGSADDGAGGDALTGLLDRKRFVDRLSRALAASPRRGSAVAVLLLDLDGFKLVNHALGHAVGDRLLVDVARRLKTSVPPDTTIARFGGDEFAVLLDDINDPAAPPRVATALIEALRLPLTVDGRETFVTASVGVAASAPHRAAAGDLIREADTALYRAKASGRAAYHVYAPGMHAPAVARLERETDLRRAVERGELALNYQPVVDLASGRIVGVEALLRWIHAVDGLLQPVEFIGLAEETELIIPLGEWTLRESCRQARAWEDLAPSPPVVSVNLSARQLVRPSLVADVAGTLAETGLNPRRLELEVTESVAMTDVRGSWETLRHLRELGVRLAIDDFGKGYSSLNHLRQLAPDTLKLDRSFVAGLDHEAGTLPIVRAVTRMAHDLGLAVTAEGIETGEQATRLRALGIGRGQGYHFAPPMESDGLARLLTGGASLPHGSEDEG